MNKLAAQTCVISITMLVAMVVVMEYYHVCKCTEYWELPCVKSNSLIAYGVLPSTLPLQLRTDDDKQSSTPPGVTEEQIQRQPSSTNTDNGATNTDNGATNTDNGATQEHTAVTLSRSGVRF